jgi:hypothetical protein
MLIIEIAFGVALGIVLAVLAVKIQAERGYR